MEAGMKKLSFAAALGIGTMLATSALAADCVKADCASLGYTLSLPTNCLESINCPFDTAYKACTHLENDLLDSCPAGKTCETKYKVTGTKPDIQVGMIALSDGQFVKPDELRYYVTPATPDRFPIGIVAWVDANGHGAIVGLRDTNPHGDDIGDDHYEKAPWRYYTNGYTVDGPEITGNLYYDPYYGNGEAKDDMNGLEHMQTIIKNWRYSLSNCHENGNGNVGGTCDDAGMAMSSCFCYKPTFTFEGPQLTVAKRINPFGTTTGWWYMPSYGELLKLANAADKINASMSAFDEEVFGSSNYRKLDFDSKCYWSSTEHASRIVYAWGQCQYGTFEKTEWNTVRCLLPF